MTDAGPDWASLAAYHADRALTVEDLPWDARCRLHEIRECLAALGGPAGRTLAEKAAAAYERVEELRQACARQNEDVCQTLGKALGYPWFKDEQTAFPGATEEHGVCVGEHVAEIRRLRKQVEALKNPPPAAAHQWRDGPLKRCIRCGDVPACCPASQAPCDPAKMDGKTEACCECGGDYPARDLISGEVFCPECRRKPWATGGVVPAGGEPVPAMLADSFSWTYNPDVYSNLQGLFARGG